MFSADTSVGINDPCVAPFQLSIFCHSVILLIVKTISSSPELINCSEIQLTNILLGKQNLNYSFVVFVSYGLNEMLLNIVKYYKEK